MQKEHQEDCLKCKDELADCIKRRCRDCEEENEEKTKKIVLLEKKIFRMTIIGTVAITLIGKELAENIMDSFSQVEKITGMVDQPLSGKESDTNAEVSNRDESFLSDGFRLADARKSGNTGI